MKELTHEIIEEQRAGFGVTTRTLIQVRLLKKHIVDKTGVKYKKDDGLMEGGHKYKGVYMENFKLDISTLKEIPASHK